MSVLPAKARHNQLLPAKPSPPPMPPPFRLPAWPLLSAPHRLYFFAGLMQLLLALHYWAIELVARLAGAGGIDVGLPPRWAHGMLMMFGTMPVFAFGFLMTAMPRWHGAAPLTPSQFRAPAALLAAGWAIVWLGLFGEGPALMASGLLLAAGGVLRGAMSLWRIARAPLPATRHARLVCAALVAIVLAQVVLAAGLLRGEAEWIHAALQLGIWWGIAPLFLVVVHRMLPVFTRGGLGMVLPETPYRLLVLVLLACAAHGLLVAAGAARWTWLVDLPAAAAALIWCWRGGLRASFAVRLLAMHHLAFGWFGVALLLHGVQSLADLAGVTWGGLAPLHALTIGFFMSMVFGMATRVSRGHSGRPVEAVPLVWWLFWVLQAATVVRVLADLLPAGAAAPLMLVAVIGALAPFMGWARSHLAMLLR